MVAATVPMPGERHPSLPDIDPDDAVQYGMVEYLQPRPLQVSSDPLELLDAPMQRGTMTLRRCSGPAPYVGRPFVYIWNVLVTDDGTNRAIGGRARIAYKPINHRDPATWPTGDDDADDAL